MQGDMGWMPGVIRRDLEVLRLYNRIVKMGMDRLTQRIFEYDCLVQGPWFKNL